jgi:hypothetical protein
MALLIQEPTVQTCSFDTTGYEVRFQSLFHEGRALSFPCDRDGHVDMDALSAKARGNYLFARAMVGREYAAPAVLAHRMH